MSESHRVLIVGGGLVGLSAALFLAWQSVPVLVIEKHSGSSLHPRAIGYTPRTLELLRAVGLGEQVPQGPADFTLRRARIESLAGAWYEESSWSPETREKIAYEYSPCLGAAIAQDRLEPILRDKAVELGAEIRLQTELVEFSQNDSGVTARLRSRADGHEEIVTADYLIAADGHRSPIRAALGIGREGRGHMRTLRSVLFRAPLDEYLASGVSQFNIDQPDFQAFLTTYRDGRWVLMFSDDAERDEQTLRALIVKAIGRDDLPIELITTGRWELSALIADTFALGRVFLAGDAAHTLPPTRGGYGANTGIDDASNLAWKLAAVLKGESSPELLASYDAERRPIARLRHDQIFVREDFRQEAKPASVDTPVYEDDAMEFGQLYRSGAVIGAGPELPPAMRPEQWAGQPGTRAPHLWIRRQGEKLSTLDLFQSGWLLLTADSHWRPAASAASQALGIDLPCIVLGQDIQAESPEALTTAYGLDPQGATLIRPDGYIAWRSSELPDQPEVALTQALAQVSAAAHG